MFEIDTVLGYLSLLVWLTSVCLLVYPAQGALRLYLLVGVLLYNPVLFLIGNIAHGSGVHRLAQELADWFVVIGLVAYCLGAFWVCTRDKTRQRAL